MPIVAWLAWLLVIGLGGDLSGWKFVWVETCLGENLSGWKFVWVEINLGENLSGWKFVRMEICQQGILRIY